MDFDDWSEASGMQPPKYQPNNNQKGLCQSKQPVFNAKQQNKVAQIDNGYYDDDFEESDEMEAVAFREKGQGANQILQQQYNMGNATYRRLQHQQSDDVDFDDDNDFDEDLSNGQDDDDFGDVQLNVRRFKSSAKKNFAKEVKKPISGDFTEESGINFDDGDFSASDIKSKPPKVNKVLAKDLATDKKVSNHARKQHVYQGQTTKIPPGIGNNKEANLKPPTPVIHNKIPDSVQDFEDTFSDDFTNNVNSEINSQMNNKGDKPIATNRKSEVETFKSDFDDLGGSFNVDFSNLDKQPAPQKSNNIPNRAIPYAQSNVGNNEITAAIINDRNLEAKYLSTKLEENDAYTKHVKNFLDQKNIEHEKLKAKYEMLVKEKVKVDDDSLDQKKRLEIQNVEIEKLVAENDTKQLELDQLTEKLNKREVELKAKTKLLQERENLFGNSLNEKKLHTNLINLSRELEIAKVRIEDYQEGMKRYEQRIIDLEDELKGSPAAMRTKALMQQRIDKLSKILAENNIKVEPTALDQGDLNEDMVYQEMILNGYIRDNKKLIEENKYLKDKLYSNKLNESKANFDTPAGRIKELEETVKRLQDELFKKDENHKKQVARFDQADEILLDREKEIERLQGETEAFGKEVRKNKAVFETQRKELQNKIDELSNRLKTAEVEKKASVEKTKNVTKQAWTGASKLQKNIFSHDDQDFKQDIVSMLNNLNRDNKQVKTDLRELKETWELKSKFGDDIKLSEIPQVQSNSIPAPPITSKNAFNPDSMLKQQLEQLRTENSSLNEKLLILEQNLNDKALMVKKSEFLQKKWYEERQNLLEIIKKMPKSTRDVDFAVLEQKVINLEKEQRLKALEIKTALKSFNNKDLSESTDTIHKGDGNWQEEKNKLLAVIKQKNDQIGKFRTQMETLVAEFKKLKAAQTN